MKISVKMQVRKLNNNKQLKLNHLWKAVQKAYKWCFRSVKKEGRLNTRNWYYSRLRARFPEIPSQVVGYICYNLPKLFRMWGKQKVVEWKARMPIEYPESRYLVKGRNINIPFSSGFGNRISIPLKVETYHENRLSEGKWKQIKIYKNRDGEWFVIITIESKPEIIEPKRILGVDIGINHTAVVTNRKGQFPIFIHGGVVKAARGKFYGKRKYYQKKNKLSKLKEIGQREANFTKDYLHKTSRAIVNVAIKKKAAIVMENLKGIRECKKASWNGRASRRYRRMLNSWAFSRLQNYIQYKAQLAGIPVFYVDARYTSQECPKCHYIEKGNRSGKWFHCKKCGYQSDADRVGAMNIAEKISITDANRAIRTVCGVGVYRNLKGE